MTGASLNLDFHSVPYFGEHPLVESHYLSKRSRRQPSILTFLAQDADSQVFCYSNADIRKGDEAEEVFRFIDFWSARPSVPRVRPSFCRPRTPHHPAHDKLLRGDGTGLSKPSFPRADRSSAFADAKR